MVAGQHLTNQFYNFMMVIKQPNGLTIPTLVAMQAPKLWVRQNYWTATEARNATEIHRITKAPKA